MKRAVIAPTALPDSALAEVKQWLGINTTREDALLALLLNAALDICESFTGTRPIEALCEEVWPVRASIGGWQALSTRPVQSIASMESITLDLTRTPLDAGDYEVSLDADGTGRFRVRDAGGESRVAVRFTAGLAPDWDSLPESLRQGIIRLAAHHHRAREGGDAGIAPPSAVAALWQPWRRMRLA